MFMFMVSVSRRTLAIDEQLLNDSDQQLRTGLTLANANQRRATDLVEDRRGALFQGPVDDRFLEHIDGPLFAPPVEPQLARIVGRGDGRGIGHVQGRQTRRE